MSLTRTISSTRERRSDALAAVEVSPRILIVGAVAVGGYFGACLAQTGADITFLVRPRRAQSLANDGLVVDTLHSQRIALPVKTVQAGDLRAEWEVVLLAVKASTLPDALDDIHGAISPQMAILPVLNGIDHIDALVARFGRDRVLGGVAAVATEMTAEGVIVQRAPGASIALGELNGTTTDRVTRINGVFAAADFESSISDDIEQAMWEKWFLMIVGGAATSLLGGTIGEINDVPDGTSVVRSLVDEIATLHAAAGHSPRPATLDRYVRIFDAARVRLHDLDVPRRLRTPAYRSGTDSGQRAASCPRPRRPDAAAQRCDSKTPNLRGRLFGQRPALRR